MVKITAETKQIIKKYTNELEKMGIHVDRVFLFGSYAHGRQHEGSDIDLVIISSDFKDMKMIKKLELLGIAAGRIMEPIEAFGYTPEEIEKGDIPPFLSEVLEEEAIRV